MVNATGADGLLFKGFPAVSRIKGVPGRDEIRRSRQSWVGERIGGDKMSMLMKGLKLIGLGVMIWGLSLLWPEVNTVLKPPVMMGVVLGFGAAALLVYILSQRLDQRHDRDGAEQDHPSSDTSVSGSIAALNTA
jgi:hypothetical protein